MKICAKELKKLIKETVNEMLKESVGMESSAVDKDAVWNAVVDLNPQYSNMSHDSEGISVEAVGESYDGGTLWSVVADLYDAKPGGWLVYEIPGELEGEVDYDVEYVGLRAAKDALYGEKDVGYEGW